MVKSNAAVKRQKNDCGCGAGPVKIEILFADWYSNAGKLAVITLPDRLNVLSFLLRWNILLCSDISVSLCGRHNNKALLSKVGLYLGYDWSVSFAVAAPVGPKENQDDRPFKVRQS